MKRLFYIFSFIVIVCIFVSCTNDEEKDWFYGEEQVLPNTEWKSTIQYFGSYSPLLPPGLEIPNRSEILSFDLKRFTLTNTRWTYNSESEDIEPIIIKELGNYVYEHPKLTLYFEDGAVIEAWISARNTIYYNDKEKGNNHFERLIKD